MRPAFTLHELLISLGVMGAVIAIAAHAAAAQLRFFSGAGELVALKNQIGQASTIAAAALYAVSSSGRELVVAQDSAIEVEMPIGSSFVCASSPGVIVMASGAPAGNTLASFTETPDEGDRGEVLFADSLGLTWLAVRPAAPPTGTGVCARFADAPAGFTLYLQEQLTLPPGAPLRFSRRTRLSLYRASDSRWYLGTRHWNAATQSFNAVQPVAGPLSPYSHDPGRTGLRFVYRDANNVELAMPVDVRAVAGISVTARSRSARFEDSTAITVALRNAQ